MEFVSHLAVLSRIVNRPFSIGIVAKRIHDQDIFVVQKVYRDGSIVDVIPTFDYEQALRIACTIVAFTEDLVCDELAALDERCKNMERALREVEQRAQAYECLTMSSRFQEKTVSDAVAEMRKNGMVA